MGNVAEVIRIPKYIWSLTRRELEASIAIIWNAVLRMDNIWGAVPQGPSLPVDTKTRDTFSLTRTWTISSIISIRPISISVCTKIVDMALCRTQDGFYVDL